MKQFSLIICLLIIQTGLFAQLREADIPAIRTVAQANSFMKAHPGIPASLFTMNSGRDTSAIDLPLYGLNPGFTFRISNWVFKIAGADSVLSSRVNYIYLNAEKISKEEIDSLRRIIMNKYRSGTPFYELVEQYNMDGNPNGDTGWFEENTMIKDFELAVKRHKKGDLFTVDLPEQKWYYVVVKTFPETYIKNLTILKIQISKQP